MRSARASRILFDVTDTALDPPAERSTLWARISPVLYEPVLSIGERRGVGNLRQEILRNAHGCTVEIGSGTGLNIQHYPADLVELTLAEPDPGMRSRLEKKLVGSGRHGLAP